MTVIEVKPRKWGWCVFESPGVEWVFVQKDQAIGKSFRFSFRLEKLPASIKRTKVKVPGMRFAVAIFEDSKGWAFHGPK